MSPYKRKGLYKPKGSSKYAIRITHNGKRIFEPVGTDDEKLAAEYYDRFMAQLWEKERLGIEEAHLWQEAVVLYLREKQFEGIRGIEEKKRHLRWLDGFLRGKRLQAITPAVMEAVADAKRTEPRRGFKNKDAPISEETVAKYLKLIRAVLHCAVKKGWLAAVPHVTIRAGRERIRWITREQAAILIAACPKDYRPIVQFALMTGLRADNIRTLRWEQLDLARRVAYFSADQMKTGKPFVCYLNDEAIAAIRSCMGRHLTYVFVNRRGVPYERLTNGTWNRARKVAGLVDFRFHDLRHTWATWHLQAGTSIYELKELGGWSSLAMVARYAHLAGSHLSQAADALSATKTPQAPNMDAGNA